MRLALVTDCWPPDPSGTALHAERCARTLRERGHAVEVVHDGAAASRNALRRRFAAQRVQAVHLATLGPLGRAALYAAQSLGLPVTADYREHCGALPRWLQWDGNAALRRRWLRALHRRCALTFVPTQALRERLAAEGFPRLDVLGRGVDAARFDPERRSDALRGAWGALDPGQRVLLYVGRLDRDPAAALALRTFEALRYLRAETRMVVVGDGLLRARLQARHPAATFVGVQRGDALAVHYASADVLLAPCATDGAAHVALEALASGLAVVTYDGVPLPAPAADCTVRVDGDAGRFIAAAARTATLAEPGTPLRTRGRDAALGASWDAVLRRFEQRLLQLLEPTPRTSARATASAARGLQFE